MQWHHYTRRELSDMQGLKINVVRLPDYSGGEATYYGFWGDNRWREIIKDALDIGASIPPHVLAEYELRLADKLANFPHYEQKGSK